MKTMKTAMILFLAVCINASFLSCSDDAGSEGTPQNTLIGKWRILTEVRANGEISELTECEKKSTLEFKSDNTFISGDHTENINNDCVFFESKGIWEEKKENVLEMNWGDLVEDTKYLFENGNLKFLGVDREGNENRSYTLYQKSK
ncbi:lipocalin-like domain-containing protein [Tenacibaculum maritimum]|uniref:lipocalin family protein n=1 Tax=Tenacibaculum maritimum TaxID=107401 RepID=UPI003877284A